MSSVQRFFDSRAPKKDHFALGIKNIYVFFSRQGLLFLGLLIVTFVAGVNYGNNLILGLFFYLLSIWVVSVVMTFLQLSSLQLSLKQITHVPAGDIAWVHLTAKNPKGKPLRQIHLSFYASDSRIFADFFAQKRKKNHPIHTQLASLSPADLQLFMHNKTVILPAVEGEISVRLPVLTQKRGVLVLPRLHIKSIYPLGVAQAWSYGFFASTGWVYPRPLAFEYSQKSQSTSHDTAWGEAYRVGQDDFDRLDDYQSGENLARVSWGHVARGLGMLTKHFADPVGQNHCIDYYAMPASLHEDKLSQMAFAVLALQGSDVWFELVLPSGRLSGSGDGFIDECLIQLAKEP